MSDFSCEADLVERFVDTVGETVAWRDSAVLREFNYLSGRTDIVLTSEDEVVAFEAKLRSWRDALDQAYRNTCFADRSFVLLPRELALKAAAYHPEFTRRGVGLCAFTHNGELEILIEAAVTVPVLEWLRHHAVSSASAE